MVSGACVLVGGGAQRCGPQPVVHRRARCGGRWCPGRTSSGSSGASSSPWTPRRQSASTCLRKAALLRRLASASRAPWALMAVDRLLHQGLAPLHARGRVLQEGGPLGSRGGRRPGGPGWTGRRRPPGRPRTAPGRPWRPAARASRSPCRRPSGAPRAPAAPGRPAAGPGSAGPGCFWALAARRSTSAWTRRSSSSREAGAVQGEAGLRSGGSCGAEGVSEADSEAGVQAFSAGPGVPGRKKRWSQLPSVFGGASWGSRGARRAASEAGCRGSGVRGRDGAGRGGRAPGARALRLRGRRSRGGGSARWCARRGRLGHAPHSTAKWQSLSRIATYCGAARPGGPVRPGPGRLLALGMGPVQPDVARRARTGFCAIPPPMSSAWFMPGVGSSPLAGEGRPANGPRYGSPWSIEA